MRTKILWRYIQSRTNQSTSSTMARSKTDVYSGPQLSNTWYLSRGDGTALEW